MKDRPASLEAARRKLDEDGYCVLPGRLDPDEAARLDALGRPRMDPRGGYVKLEGALDPLPDLAPLCADDQVLDLVAHLLGDEFYLANNVCLMWCQPGATGGRPHSDWPLGGLATPWPRFALLAQTMWMLTDFTAENGATRVVPGSHRSGQPPPPDCSERDVAVTGRRGDVLIWHGALWHRNGANTSAQAHRMGANVAYIPWFVHRPPAAWPLVRRDLFAGFPPRLQQLLARSVQPPGGP